MFYSWPVLIKWVYGSKTVDCLCFRNVSCWRDSELVSVKVRFSLVLGLRLALTASEAWGIELRKYFQSISPISTNPTYLCWKEVDTDHAITLRAGHTDVTLKLTLCVVLLPLLVIFSLVSYRSTSKGYVPTSGAFTRSPDCCWYMCQKLGVSQMDWYLHNQRSDSYVSR